MNNHLRMVRNARGLTQRQLAESMGKTAGIISRQLNGLENLSLAKLVELAYHVNRRVEIRMFTLSQRALPRDKVCKFDFGS